MSDAGRAKDEEIGTPQRPFYFLHIPKTAGSSLNRLIDDSFHADVIYRPHVPSVGCLPDLSGGFGVYRGHLGVLPMLHQVRPLATVTLLRDPAARAWSHFRFLRWRYTDPTYGFEDFLGDPAWEDPGADFQARWLAFEPDDRMFVADAPNLTNYTNALVHRPPAWPASIQRNGSDLERLARRSLDACSLVGTVERLPEFIDGLERLLGRRLSPLMRLNVSPQPEIEMPADTRDLIRKQSPTDIRLWRDADERLDAALASLPRFPVPPDPVGREQLPFTHTMADPLVGSGWHARVHTRDAGWHRWSGPGQTSEIELPVRLSARVKLEVDILAACEPEVLDSLRFTVQGRRARPRFTPRLLGLTATMKAKLSTERPTVIKIEVARTAHLADPAGGRSPDRAGVAIGDIRLSRWDRT